MNRALSSGQTVGDRIRERRLALGLRQRDLADEGVTYSHISYVEANRRQPSLKALRKLAAKLDVSPHWLETSQDDPAEQLARLVLEHPGRRLPPQAASLARRVLRHEY
jgi:transcriptional regulator with XRE-family HTH domain